VAHIAVVNIFNIKYWWHVAMWIIDNIVEKISYYNANSKIINDKSNFKSVNDQNQWKLQT